MDKPKPKGLVEVLRARAALWKSAPSDLRDSDWDAGNARGLNKAAELAEPFEARRLALEKVYTVALAHLIDSTGSKISELVSALAAVPPLPEVPDAT